MAVPVAAASAAAKRLWSVLRITFLMIRKGLIISNSKSKRKLMMDLNLMMKRGKLLKRSFRNFIAHHQSSSSSSSKHKLHYHYDCGFGIQEYEFSCSNSPNIPVFFHTSSKAKQQRSRHYFPCINPPHNVQFDDNDYDSYDYDGQGGDDIDENHNNNNKAVVVMQPKTPDYSTFKRNSNCSSSRNSPLIISSSSSPFSVRVSNYSSTEVDVDQNRQVDDEAEEFIDRFYEQLRAQSRIQLLQYQDD